MKTIFRERDLDALERRLEQLAPDAVARFGRMSPHQAVRHLYDAFRIAMGDRKTTARADTLFNRTVGRVFALTLPFPWPKGVPTAAEADQERAGSTPGDFKDDVAALRAEMRRFHATGGNGLAPHIALGDLTAAEWGRWGYRHVDHHLRQFGA